MASWSTSKQSGFILAALLVGDRDLEAVERALAPARVTEARAHLRGDGAVVRDRARLVAHLLATVRRPLTGLPDALPARLRALLAPRLPRALGRTLLEAAAPPSSGFAPPDDLLPRLLRIARRSIEPGDDRP